MKSGKVAKALGIDPKTVKAWTDEFAEFFTEDAQGYGRTQRFYQPEDLIVLNTIRVERSKRVEPEKIQVLLQSGYRNESFPAEYYTVEGDSAIVQYTQLAMLRIQVTEKEAEISRIRQERDAELERLQRERVEERERLMNEIAKLNREIGKLQAKIEIFEDNESD
jgi:DNA-binding transcriptional MerR regulator